MATYNVELRQRINDTFADIIYPKAHWSNIDGKPSTFTPTAHGHNAKDINIYVAGTGTVAGTWLGTIDGLTEYYDGLTIRYRIPIAGAATTTLNINGLGAVLVQRYVGSTNITTHFAVNAVITMTKIGSSWVVQDWYDSTDDYGIRWINNVTAGAAITRYKIIMQGADGKYYPLTINDSTAVDGKVVSTQEFLLDGHILQYNSTSAAIAANAVFGSYYLWSQQYANISHYTFNQVSGWVAGLPVYLKGTIQTNGTFKLDNTTLQSWLTQTLPTTDDGFVYIKLGYMHNTTTTYTLTADHPAYHYKDGALRVYVPTHTHSMSAITDFNPLNYPEFIGPQGIQGIQGIQGPKGATGTTGPKGDKGDKGDIGLQGPQGIQGPRGYDFQYSWNSTQLGVKSSNEGSYNYVNLLGPQGIQGIQGIQGPKGDTGATGLKGDKGDTGAKGDKGDQGIQGPKGDTGPAGSDATVTKAAVEAVLTGAITSHTHLYAGAATAGGAASTATKLATARAITVGPTAKNFDGSAAITYTLAEIGINVVTTCPTAAATAGRVNIYTGAACATKYANWLYFET